MSWLSRNWRSIALLIAGAASALAAEHTVYKRTGLDKLVPAIINAVPCTPGEPNCTSPADSAQPPPR